MKKILLIVMSFIFLYNCSGTNNQEEVSDNRTDIEATDIIEKKITKEERITPNWLNILSEIEFSDIENNWDNYSYNYQPEKTDNGEVNRLLTYTKNSDGEFLGSMKLSFSNIEETYIETIPKTFAEHVNDLDFSVQPSKIINPDPVVEFTNIKGKLEIKAKKIVKIEEVKETMERQLFDREFARCEGLNDIEMQNCALQLVAKYRGSKVLEEELSIANFDLTTVFGASVYAVQKQGFRKCSLVKDEEGKNLCYEYAYQILVAECNTQIGKDYRTCVRSISLQLPNQEVRRLFCYYIDDEQMYNECRWTAEMSVCDEIENEDQKMICQINIAKTEGNIDSCNKIESIDAQDICRAMMGMDQNNEKYCNLVKDEYYKWECLIKVALRNDDEDICNNITHKTQKDMCLGHFMIKKNGINQEICDGFNDEFMKDMCNLLLIIQKNDAKKCETISDLYNKNLCYLTIAIKTKNKELCNKITSSEAKNECIKSLEKPKIELPKIPDWMDCPIADGAKLKIWTNKQQSGYKYVDSKISRKNIGPYMKYWGENFDHPGSFICYNSEWDKHWPFKEYNQTSFDIQKEGYYNQEKYDKELREYSGDFLYKMTTYTKGVKNWPAEVYCIFADRCEKGKILRSGSYKNNKMHGMWTFYKNGEIDYKSEFINGEVTRDEDGMNIRYR